MDNLLLQIDNQCKIFADESEKFKNGNKAAGARARKASLELDKLLKQFRKESV